MSASTIWADSLGASVPRARLAGTVHSVFPRACNVLLEDSRVVSLLAPEIGHALGVSRDGERERQPRDRQR